MAESLRIKEFDWATVPADTILRDGGLDVFPSVQGKDYFATRLTREAVQVQARGYVGVIPLNDRLTLEVVPRIGLSNLSRLVEISRVPPKQLVAVMRNYRPSGTIYPSLISLYADGLHRAVEEIASRGFLREYEWCEEVSSYPRGRILIGKTLQQATARGTRHKAAFGWHQRTTDISANRCLVYAAWRLAHYSRQSADIVRMGERRRTARQLNRCLQHLKGIQLDPTAGFLNDPFVTGRLPLPTLRGYYRPALDLALAIIGGQAVDIEDQNGGVRLPSLLIDMSSVFEAYLRHSLQRIAREDGWRARILDGNLLPSRGAAKTSLLDDGEPLKATPDIVIEAGPRRTPEVPVLIEVKYKLAERLPQRDDLNQVIAYGKSYRARTVVIVQPASGTTTPGWRRLGTLDGMTVGLYSIDLSADDLVMQEAVFADAIRALLPTSAPT